jgi:hypothetical protein
VENLFDGHLILPLPYVLCCNETKPVKLEEGRG